MKIAVPYDENGNVVLHLKHTEQFKIYDCMDDEILSEELVSLSSECSGEASLPFAETVAELLLSRNTFVLICGLLPVSVLMKLQASRIQVLGGASGSALDRVNDFLGGALHFDRGGSCASCSGSCSLEGSCSGNCSGSPAEEEPECDGNISACGHWCH